MPINCQSPSQMFAYPIRWQELFIVRRRKNTPSFKTNIEEDFEACESYKRRNFRKFIFR